MTQFFLTSWAENPVSTDEQRPSHNQLPEVQIDIGFCVLRSGPEDAFQEGHRIDGNISLRSTKAPEIRPQEREQWVRDLLQKVVDKKH
ncbi:hypothetical protein [Acetobacter senegalensis]|uniref:hypothetical protein n=1 Tax=Acetobacter senegalensis TaxID=446692 RepID=UPI001EE0BA05|nr:hypothetical protein [Acetobacter senegalensis]MCG4273923.1 hypothetical protein [Acetobacter senegalensis]